MLRDVNYSNSSRFKMPKVYEVSHSEVTRYSTQQQTANLRALQITYRPFYAFEFMEGTSGYDDSYPANDTCHEGNIHGINYSFYYRLKLLSGT
jgi:hypothetical protein